jgi:NAD(P)-dependent dehydrogenase (short-subunit alcohol dehydrogenase family)
MDLTKSLENKTAVITGGGSGIGKSIAAKYLACGANVVIASRKEEKLSAAVEDLQAIGNRISYKVLDVRLPHAVEKAMDEIAATHNGIDVLVNNAAANFIAPAEKMSPNAWKIVIDIVLNGSYYCSHFAGKHMIEKKAGKILNVIASYAWTGNAGTVHSAAAKAGVLAMTRTLAIEWARYNIQTNAIAPGIVDTPGAHANLWDIPQVQEALLKQIPSHRFADGEEIANACLFLVSEAGDYINGEVLTMDAGLWLNRSMMSMKQIDAMHAHLMSKREK